MHRGQVDRLPVAVRELINPLLDAFERRVAELEQADASTQVRAVHRRRRWGLTPSALTRSPPRSPAQKTSQAEREGAALRRQMAEQKAKLDAEQVPLSSSGEYMTVRCVRI